MYAAIWVHAAVGLPWVILLVGVGLRWVERELERTPDLRRASPRDLVRDAAPGARGHRRRRPVGGFAVATEISVTDMMLSADVRRGSHAVRGAARSRD
jgi:hypothetical protein